MSDTGRLVIDPAPRGRPGDRMTSPRGARSIAIIAVLFALQIADGIDQTALAIVAPAVRAAIRLGPQSLGAALSAGFIGTGLGSIVFGTIGDRIGRRLALSLPVAFFSAGSFCTVFVHSGGELIAIRLATGIALGGLFPVIAAIVLDTVRAGLRATAVTLVSVGTAVGTSLCGPLVAILQPRFGWQAIFVFGGALPAMLILFAVLLIPRVPVVSVTADQARPRTPLDSVATLFSNGRWRLTLLIWAAFVGAAFPMFFSLSWLPSLAHDAGLSPATASLGPSVFALAGMLVALVVARTIDRLGIHALALTSALGVPGLILLGQAFGGPGTFLTGCAVAGGLCVSCVNLMGAIAATHYPAALRARGVGWALAIMRLGGAAAPGIGGVLIARGFGPATLFAGLSTGLAITAVAVWRIGRSTWSDRVAGIALAGTPHAALDDGRNVSAAADGLRAGFQRDMIA